MVVGDEVPAFGCPTAVPAMVPAGHTGIHMGSTGSEGGVCGTK